MEGIEEETLAKTEEKNKEHTPETNSDYEFLREKIKDRPLNRRKIFRRMAITAGSAILFGGIACAVFILVGQAFNRRPLNTGDTELTRLEFPKEEVQEEELPDVEVSTEEGENIRIDKADEDEEDTTQEETVIVETPIEEMAENKTEEDTHVEETVPVVTELELSDYQLLYRKLTALSKEVSKSMVTITYVSENLDWLDDTNWYKNHASGMILGNNGKDLLILALHPQEKAEVEYRVTFQDGTVTTATLQSRDADTEMAVYAVKLSALSQETKDAAVPVTLGSSTNSSILGSAVLAVGSPLGNPSVCYGAITGNSRKINLPDASYQLLTTDIYGSQNAGGILVNTKGQVIGLICLGHHEAGMENLVYAYGISDIRKLMENLSNNVNIAYLGITTGPVTEEARTVLGVPKGAYVLKTEMNSPAMAVGILAGDIITQIEDISINNQSDYMLAIGGIEPGTEITMQILRLAGGEYREMNVTLTTGSKYKETE